MVVLKYILIVIVIVLGLGEVLLVMMQRNDDQGMSSTITGAAANNYLDKNKGRTKEGKLKKMTIIFGIAFAVAIIALNIVYPLA